MAGNRQQRRAAAKHKGKRPGETYMDVLTQKKMIQKAVEDSVHDHSVALESDIKTQRFLWMSVAALNMAFGFAGVRAQRYMLALDEVREDMEKMAKKNGWEYAIEKLREQCQKITGIEIKQVHEEEMRRARKENEANGIFFPAEDPDTFCETDFAPLFEKKKRPEWIPVSERLPDCDGRYLCNIKSHAFKGCYYRDIRKYDRGGFLEDGYIYTDDVTHWMELPDGPEEVST